jgi:hypothetical protein
MRICSYLHLHDKFMTPGMYAPYVIPQELTKWHIQLMHILSDIAFHIPTMFEFF